MTEALRLIADGLTLLGLAVMASLARTAWQKLPADARVPMQWNLKGKVVWSASKRVGLLALPVIASLVLFGLMAALRFRSNLPPVEAILLFVMRIGLVGGLIAAQLSQLNSVLHSLKRASS